jgi:superfamily II DNA or RNA helicase
MDYHPILIFNICIYRKLKTKKFDYVVVDEAHLLGEENQLSSGLLAKKINI